MRFLLQRETIMKSTLAEHKMTSLRHFNGQYITYFCNCHLKIHNTHEKSTVCDFPTVNFDNGCKQIRKVMHQPFDLKSYLFSLELTGRTISISRKTQVLVY